MATLFRQRVLFCGRCGWRGRVRLAPVARGEDAVAESTGRRRRRRHAEEPNVTTPAVSDLDLDALDRSLDGPPSKRLL